MRAIHATPEPCPNTTTPAATPDDRAERMRNHVFDMETPLEDARAATAVLILLCERQGMGGPDRDAVTYLAMMLNQHLADARTQWEAMFNLVMEEVRHAA